MVKPLAQIQRIHIVGIGGAGMSPLARILHQMGHKVTGSDLYLSPVTEGLQALGLTIYKGHSPQHIADADLVVTTAAAKPDNPELVAAREKGIPVIKGAALLGMLMEGKKGICIAGTHGKTTTTAMIAAILVAAGWDPSYVIGGEPKDLPASGHWGSGPYFVAEADEYDRRFLSLHPTIAVVTSLEADHPDCYPTMSELVAAFQGFIGLVPPDGWVVGCGDDPGVRGLLADGHQGEAGGSVRAPRITYGLLGGSAWQATGVEDNGQGGSDFSVRHLRNDGAVEEIGRFRLVIPGRHNVNNALAAIVVGSILGVPVGTMQQTLAKFRGVARRFDVLGQVSGVTIIDDYAHHPSEIRATLAAAKQQYPGRRLVAVHQPHTYSRLKALLPAFAQAFDAADQVLVVDIYAARETDTLGMHSRQLVAAMHHPDARYIGTLADAVNYLQGTLQPGDVLITLGAGDVNKVGKAILAYETGRGGGT